MVDLTEGKLDEALEYAKKIGDESLQSCLDRLKKTEETYELDGRPIQINVSTDFAPLSFYFEKHDKSTACSKVMVELYSTAHMTALVAVLLPHSRYH